MKRSKQKSGASPRLGPGASPRLRSNSVSSISSIPEMTPDSGSLVPQSVGGLLLGDDMMLGGSAVPDPQQQQQQFSSSLGGRSVGPSFRSLTGVSGLDGGVVPADGTMAATGLSVLMSNIVYAAPRAVDAEGSDAPTPIPVQHFDHQQQQQQRRLQRHQQMREEMIDRERQASALAAAGMVAERVSRSRANSIVDAPPDDLPVVASAASWDDALGGNGGPGASSSAAAGTETEALSSIEDMEMDFAKMFDPQSEVDAMNTEGSGWPAASPQICATTTTAHDTTSLLGGLERD